MLKRKINPTFPGKVKIPTFDGENSFEEITVTFKYRDRDALLEFQKSLSGRKDVDILMDVISDWSGVEDDFSKETLEEYLKLYHGMTAAIYSAYMDALTKERVKN